MGRSAIVKSALFFLDNKYFVWVICVLTICLISLINRYPVLYSDTSTYISSGFELETPADRPITYGILLRIFSLNGLSFTFVPIFQAFIFTYMLFKSVRFYCSPKNENRYVLFLSLLLTITTGFNWCINQLIPDFLSSVGYLTLLCILLNNTKLNENKLMLFLFFISASCHISNVFPYLLILAIVILFQRKVLPNHNKTFLKQKSLAVFILLIISYLIMASAIAKSKSIFYTGSLAQKGILQEILKDKCSLNSFELCNYKDSIPTTFEGFVWKPESPLYKIGGWKAARGELEQISNISLTDSKYLLLQVNATIKNFTHQLFLNDIGEGNGPYKENTVLIQRIKKFSVLDENICTKSKQAHSAFLNLIFFNNYYSFMYILSFLLLIVMVVYKFKTLSHKVKILLFLTTIFILCNYLLIAFSSEISNRHGCKLIWLIPFLNFVVFTAQRKAPIQNSRSE